MTQNKSPEQIECDKVVELLDGAKANSENPLILPYFMSEKARIKFQSAVSGTRIVEHIKASGFCTTKIFWQ